MSEQPKTTQDVYIGVTEEIFADMFPKESLRDLRELQVGYDPRWSDYVFMRLVWQDVPGSKTAESHDARTFLLHSEQAKLLTEQLQLRLSGDQGDEPSIFGTVWS